MCQRDVWIYREIVEGALPFTRLNESCFNLILREQKKKNVTEHMPNEREHALQERWYASKWLWRDSDARHQDLYEDTFV